MATNLALDDSLIEEARRAGGHKTKKEAVTAALAEYVKRRKQLRILKSFGTIDFDPSLRLQGRAPPKAFLNISFLTGSSSWFSEHDGPRRHSRLVTGSAANGLSLESPGTGPDRRPSGTHPRSVAPELIGPVRQELLSGIRQETSFQKLRDQLRAFDEPIRGADYEDAAHSESLPHPRHRRISHRFPDLRRRVPPRLASLHHRSGLHPLRLSNPLEALPGKLSTAVAGVERHSCPLLLRLTLSANVTFVQRLCHSEARRRRARNLLLHAAPPPMRRLPPPLSVERSSKSSFVEGESLRMKPVRRVTCHER